MKCITIDPLYNGKASLDIYLRDKAYEFVDHSRRPFVLVLPGGGYSMLAPHEGEPVAMAFLQAGYQVGVLSYTVRSNADAPFLGSTPLEEAAAAIRLVRSNAEQWGIDPAKISVCGFSAGGHLAGSIGVFGSDPHRIPNGQDGTAQPNAMILCYPLICSGNYHSIYNLTGMESPCPERDAWSLDLHTTSNTCPAFIWTTSNDNVVDAKNSLQMATALQQAGVNVELHMYGAGHHGMSLANTEAGTIDPHISTWMSLALQWLNTIGVGPGY